MKALVCALSLLLTICLLIGIHSFSMHKWSADIKTQSDRVFSLVNSNNWSDAINIIDEIQKSWDKKRIWAALTLDTGTIEEIEISLLQSRAYAVLQQKPDFFGEFLMFTKLVAHIPNQEGFDVGEIL